MVRANTNAQGGGELDISRRAFWAFGAGAVIATASVARLFWLQVIKQEEYSTAAAQSRTVSDNNVPAHRGTIYDRNGNILATSVDATTVYVNPKEVTSALDCASALAETLGGELNDYLDLVRQDSTFVYIERQVEDERADALKELDVTGIHYISDTKRVYPYGEVGGQIIGYVNVDGDGISGLEYYYEDDEETGVALHGTNGAYSIQQGRDGTPIPGGTEYDVEPVDGQDIVISIDIELQAYVEERIAKAVSDFGGSDGIGIVMDASTGEILACCSTPYFNPSDPSECESGSESLKGIIRGFEPGSIFKTPCMTAMLEAEVITPDDTTVECPVYLEADEYEVSDAHDRAACSMTPREVLRVSSNVGISMLVSEYLGFPELYDALTRYGLNDYTYVDYPGESMGYMSDTDIEDWPLISKYNLTFGQGINVTPIQMIRFYSALANGGVAVTPHFLVSKPQTGETMEYEQKQIIENEDALPEIVSMLETVVESGTGKNAAIDGFTVAGKTGTAEFADEDGGYVDGVYNLDFLGFLPNSTLPLVCFVCVTKVNWETNTCGIFKDIMSEAISRFRVAEL